VPSQNDAKEEEEELEKTPNLYVNEPTIQNRMMY
jgi:hypothetical protein